MASTEDGGMVGWEYSSEQAEKVPAHREVTFSGETAAMIFIVSWRE